MLKIFTLLFLFSPLSLLAQSAFDHVWAKHGRFGYCYPENRTERCQYILQHPPRPQYQYGYGSGRRPYGDQYRSDFSSGFESRTSSNYEENASSPRDLNVRLLNSKTGLVDLSIPLGRKDRYNRSGSFNSEFRSNSEIRSNSEYSEPVDSPSRDESEVSVSQQVAETKSAEICPEGEWRVENGYGIPITVSDGTYVCKVPANSSRLVPEPMSGAGYRAFVKDSEPLTEAADAASSGVVCFELRREKGEGFRSWKFETVLGVLPREVCDGEV